MQSRQRTAISYKRTQAADEPGDQMALCCPAEDVASKKQLRAGPLCLGFLLMVSGGVFAHQSE